MPRALRRAVAFFACAIAFAGLVVASAIAHAQTDVGRAAIRDQLAEMVGDRMAGPVHIDTIASMWPGPVTLVGIAVRDPSGRPVLRLDRVKVWIRPEAFLSGGDIVAHRARVEGGEVRLVETPSGKLTIELAFEPDRVRDRRTVSIERIRFAGIRAIIDPEDVPTIVLDRIRGLADFERTPEQRVKLRIDRVVGEWVKPNPPGVEIEIARIEGWLNSKAGQTFEVSTLGTANDERFAAELRYFPRRKPGMHIHYKAYDRSAATVLGAVGLDAVEGLSDKVETITELPPTRGERRRDRREERREERREARRRD